MENIQTTVLITHTLIALVIIVLVLLQRGKGADAGAAFGAGASGTVFGSRGSTNFFSRVTAVLATVFFATSLTLAYMASQTSGGPASMLDDAPVVEVEDEATQPADEGDGFPDLPAVDGEDAPAVSDDLPSLPPEEEASEPETQQ